MFGINKEKKFWNWFEKNNSQYLFLNEMEEDIKEQHMDEFLHHLHQYAKGLYFLIGGHPDEQQVDLIITADGIVEYFPAVEKLIGAAPEMKDWRFIAFKPPEGVDFLTEIGGRTFNPKETLFIPLSNKDEPSLVGLQVCYPDFHEAERNLFIQGTYIMIDSIIGEKSGALDIDYLEVVKTPDDLEDLQTLTLAELPEFIRFKKGQGMR